MPLLLIPILIIVGIFAVSAGDELIKDLDLPTPSFRLFPEPTEDQERQPSRRPQGTTIRQTTPGPSPPPKPSPSPQQEQEDEEPTASPYAGKVEIARLQTATGDSPSLITITGKLAGQESVNLTGWTVKGRAGSYTIPYASKTVDPGLLLNRIHEVTLTRGGKILISSARGPFGLNSNFQPNKCMAHLRPSLSFPIPVPSSCKVEKPTEGQVLYFSLACQDYVLNTINYSSCTPPELTEANEVTLDSECTRYLDELFEEFTYQGCIKLRQADENFFKNEWHLYRNADLLTQRADAIELYDANGLFVHRKEY